MLKRIRPGAYECRGYLLQHTPWAGEKWDGPRESYRGWKIYRAGSIIEKRVLIDAFGTRRMAYDYIRRQLAAEPRG